MLYDLYFCYRIEKEAGMGTDEEGNPCAIYAQIKLGECDTENRMPEQEERSHKEMGIQVISEQFNIAPEHITPISKEEYDANNYDDEVSAMG